MKATSLNAYLAERRDDPAIRLFAETAAAIRSDAGYLASDDDVAAALFLAEESPAALSETAFEQALARIAAAEARDAAAWPAEDADPTLAEVARLPSPLREEALGALRGGGWRVGGLGIRRLPLSRSGETHAELMRIEPGRGAAPHDHGGDELTLVLSGGYADGHHHYGPGDVSLAQGEFVHAPKADPGEPCYVLAVTYGEARFFGLIGFLQRLGLFRTPVRAAAG